MAQDSQDGQHQILGSQPPGQAEQHQPPGQGGERQSPGRLRRKQNIRRLVSEHAWSVDDLVMPLFVADQTPPRIPVASIPGMDYLNIAGLLDECKTLTQLQIPGIALFPRIRATLKNKRASEATNPANMYLAAIRAVKQHYPDLIVFSDVALDPYHADGHDGIMQDAGANANANVGANANTNTKVNVGTNANTNTNVNLPATLTALAEMALPAGKSWGGFCWHHQICSMAGLAISVPPSTRTGTARLEFYLMRSNMLRLCISHFERRWHLILWGTSAATK